jgi:hypothetical protein
MKSDVPKINAVRSGRISLRPRTCSGLLQKCFVLILTFFLGLAGLASGQTTPNRPSSPATGTAKIYGWVPPTGNSACGLETKQQCRSDYLQYVLPHVDGVSLEAWWSKIESSNGNKSGGYDFSKYDEMAKTFLNDPHWSADKKIIIVISPISHKGNNINTPSYVFTREWAKSVGAPPLDVCTCDNYGEEKSRASNGCSNRGGDTTGFPAVFEEPFKAALKNLYAAVIKHYNSVSWHSQIAYIRLGTAVGGESFPWCSGQLRDLVSPQTPARLKAVWTGYTEEMYAYEAGLGAAYPLMTATNGGQNSIVDATWSQQEAADAVSHGLVLGSQGLQMRDISSHKAGQSCSNDFCNIYNQHYPRSAILEMQTASPTDPAGQQRPGSLVDLLPFAIARHANAFELFPQDLFIAYNPNYNPPDKPGYNQFHAAYAVAIEAARRGQ